MRAARSRPYALAALVPHFEFTTEAKLPAASVGDALDAGPDRLGFKE